MVKTPSRFRLLPVLLRIASACLALPSAWAGNSLETETTFGNSSWTEALTLDHHPAPAPDGTRWGGSFEYNFSRSSTTDATTGTAVTDDSHGFTLGGSVKKKLEAGAGLYYSVTPAENLTSFGPDAYLAWTLKLGPVPETSDDSDDFRASLKFKLRGATVHYTQASTTTTRLSGIRRLVAASESIRQSNYGVDLTFAPRPWFSVTAGLTQYVYDKAPAQFLTYLDSPLALRLNSSGLSNTVSGFYSNSQSASFTLTPLDGLDVVGQLTLYCSATDGSFTRFGKLRVFKELGRDWTLGLGAEKTVYATSESLGWIASLTLEF